MLFDLQEFSATIRTFEYHESIGSTSDRVKELLRQPTPPELPCLVIAKTQTAGRGRANKIWWSGDGALLMSLGFEIAALHLTRDELPLLSQATALAVLEMLRERMPQQEVTLHLPNDVYVEGKKISGILLESPNSKHVVAGVGINVNNRLAAVPAEFYAELEARQITSMIEFLGTETDHAELVRHFLAWMQKTVESIMIDPDGLQARIAAQSPF